MTILIVQGPHAGKQPLGDELAAGLGQLAQAAGHSLSICRCSALPELVGSIRSAQCTDTEFMLIDPGELAEEARAHPEQGLIDALAELRSPYIDVTDDSATTLEAAEPRDAAPLATVVIQGDLATGYRIALGIALRQLAA